MTTIQEKQEKILDLVCSYFNVKKTSILSPLRVEAVRKARHVAMYLFREYLKLSLSDIGRYFGRDHTSIIHACRQIRNCLEIGDYLAEDVKRLTELMKRYEYMEESQILVKLPKGVDLNKFVSDLTINYKVSYTII